MTTELIGDRMYEVHKKSKKYNRVQGRVTEHLAGGNPESLVGKHLVDG